MSFAVERPADHVYYIGRGQNRFAGVDADGRQVVITNTRYSRSAYCSPFCFDLDGGLIAVECEERSPATYHIDSIDECPDARRLAARLGLVPGPVTVQRFHHHPTGFRLADFTEEQWNLIHNPPTPDTADAEEAGP